MRDEQSLLQLRPDLGLDSNHSGPEETFQNQTLRPVLKMQHDLLVRLFRPQISKQKVPYFNWTREVQKEWVARTLRSDSSLRQMLVGIVIGHFTLDELDTYMESESNLRRRLISLLVQRLQSVDFAEQADC